MLGGGRTILLADDDPGVLGMLTEALGRLGYRVVAATNGMEALELFEKHRDAIDMLMFDVMMPKLKGTAAAATIREACPDIPLLFVTGYSDKTTLNDMEKLKNYGLIQKPMQISNLGQMLRCFFE